MPRRVSGYKTRYAAPAGETGIVWEALGEKAKGKGRISVDKRSKHGKMERRGKDGQPHVSRQLVGTFSGQAVPDDCGLSCLLVKLF